MHVLLSLRNNPPLSFGHIITDITARFEYCLLFVLLEFRTPTTQGFFVGGDAANACEPHVVAPFHFGGLRGLIEGL